MADDQAAYPLHQRQLLRPGWYWAIVDARETATLSAWQAERKGIVAVTKTAAATLADGSTERPASWILFEVKSDTVWTLPGYPVKAPKGAATTPNDILGTTDGMLPSIFSPQHPWNQFWGFGLDTPENERPPGQELPKNPLGQIVSSVGTAGTVLIWGTALYVGYLIFQGLAPVRGASRAAKRAS